MNEFEARAKEAETRNISAVNGKESAFFDVGRFRHEERIASEPMIDSRLVCGEEPKKSIGFWPRLLGSFKKFLRGFPMYRY